MSNNVSAPFHEKVGRWILDQISLMGYMAEQAESETARVIGAVVCISVALVMLAVILTIPAFLLRLVIFAVIVIIVIRLATKWSNRTEKTPRVPPVHPKTRATSPIKNTKQGDGFGKYVLFFIAVILVILFVGYAVSGLVILNQENRGSPAQTVSYHNGTPGHFAGNPRDRFHGPDRDSIVAYLSKYPHDSLLIEIIGCESGYQQFVDPERRIVLRNGKYPFVVGAAEINEQANANLIAMSGQNVEQLVGNIEVAHILYEERGTAPWESSAACWRDHVSNSGIVPSKVIAVASAPEPPKVYKLKVIYTTPDGKLSEPVYMYGDSSRVDVEPGVDVEICTDGICADESKFYKPILGIENPPPPSHVDVMRFLSRKRGGRVTVTLGKSTP